MPLYLYTSMPLHPYISTPLYLYASISLYLYTSPSLCFYISISDSSSHLHALCMSHHQYGVPKGLCWRS